jgi:hypothetical protein
MDVAIAASSIAREEEEEEEEEEESIVGGEVGVAVGVDGRRKESWIGHPKSVRSDT